MLVKDLSLLETVREVTDFVLVQASHPQFRSLSFLRNLEVINGRKLGRLAEFVHIFIRHNACALCMHSVVLAVVWSLTHPNIISKWLNGLN